MAKVTGIGGVFFKCKDPKATKAWYKEMLGIDAGEYGMTFKWKEDHRPDHVGSTVWSPFSADTTYFGSEDQDYMINYRVDDLDALLEVLKAKGVVLAGKPEAYEYGKFAWVVDCDGRKIELWEPVNEGIL